VFGFLYWKALVPVHRQVFVWLARHRVTRARSLRGARSADVVQ
jgi:hypothetical protein